MQPDNPFSAPQAELREPLPAPSLPGWSVRQLQVLGWLALVSVLGNALVMASLFAGGLLQGQEVQVLARVSDWLSLALMLLGCYLLLRFKAFAEVRFGARRLHGPIWSLVLVMLALDLVSRLFADGAFAGPNWQTIIPMALLCIMGGCSTWLGLRLLRLDSPYTALKVMAWLEIVGGLMLASVLLILLAIVPLLGASVALALVFFKAADELREALRN